MVNYGCELGTRRKAANKSSNPSSTSGLGIPFFSHSAAMYAQILAGNSNVGPAILSQSLVFAFVPLAFALSQHRNLGI